MLVLFSGPQDRVGSLPMALCDLGATPVCIDVCVGGRLHDLLDASPSSIGALVLDSARRGHFVAVHSGVPCHTWSVARSESALLRSWSADPLLDHSMGLPDLSPRDATAVGTSNALLVYTLAVADAVIATGGQVTIENPAFRGDPSQPHVYWPEKAHHASIFRTRIVMDFARASSCTLVTFPQCACGHPFQKYTSVLCSPGALPVFRPIDGARCTHTSHERVAYGIDEHGRSESRESGAYGEVLSVLFASALLGVSREDQGLAWGVSEGVVEPPTRGDAVRVLGYVAPTHLVDTPDDDLSDDEEGTFSASWSGVHQAYASCIKVPRATYRASARVRWSRTPDTSVRLACKANVRVRFSTSESGMQRHEIPRGYHDAMRHEDCAHIWEAMVREWQSHQDCGSWELRPATECYAAGREPIDCMWVYDAKIDKSLGTFLFWKARLVARGDQMVYLRDYLDTYAGVVRHSTFRLFLAMAATLGLFLTGADVSTAYLHAPLRNVTVWMRQPLGFVYTVNGKEALCLLRMAVYGLRQSAREWAITLTEWLIAYGFVRCHADRYLFVLRRASEVLVLLLYVDDIFLRHSCPALRREFMSSFAERFRTKDLGSMSQALGASVSQSVSEGWVRFGLSHYIVSMAERFSVAHDVSWADIPVPIALARECMQSVASDTEVADSIEMYSALVGVIVFVGTFARPDVAFAAHFLARFMVRPGPVHLRLARRVMGYLSRTRDFAITYRRGDGTLAADFRPMESPAPDTTGLPNVPVDTDHAVDRSVTGWLFMLAGAAVSWAVRAQQQPSLSSSEAELYGLSTAVCDLVSMTQLIEFLGIDIPDPVPILSDSRGARLVAEDSSVASRMRHIHRRWYFTRHYVDTALIVIRAVKGEHNHANFLTKPVGGASFACDRSYAFGGL